MKRILIVKGGDYKGTHEALILVSKDGIESHFSIPDTTQPKIKRARKAVRAFCKSEKLKLAAMEDRLPDTIILS